MRTLSPFQLLPPHVVQLVVNHVVGSSRLQLNGVKSNSVEYYKLHLYVRADKVYVEKCSWTRCIDYPEHPDYPSPPLAREIRIRVYAYDIYEGQALQQLSTKPYDGCAFPQARELTFELVVERSYAKDTEYTSPGADANTLVFIRRIRDMGPRVNKVYLSISYRNGDMAPSSGKHMRFLVSKLSTLTDTTFFTDGCDELFKSPDLVSVCKLACISFKIMDDASRILQLTRFNAPTLQTFNIWSHHDVDISGLIQDPDDGKYVEYPCVRTLTIGFADISISSQRSSFRGAIPFPILQRLDLRSCYPFGDDVVFRGNGATLGYLTLSLIAEFVTLLTKHSVFTSTSRPKLQYVAIHLPFTFHPDEFAEATSCLQFGYGIAPGISIRSIVANEYKNDVISQNIPLLGSDGNLQCLYIPKTSLSIWEVVTLIKSLPQGIKEKLPDYVRATYAPMGERFRCWHLSSAGYPIQVVLSVLLLTLICPNFDHVAVEYTRSQLFMKILERQISMPRFKQYAPRLERLLVSHKKR